MIEHIDTAIIGGGQAGLAVSYYLNRHGCQNVVLEQAAQAANAWRNQRWDSFTLVNPNWMVRLPGAEYQGDDPEGFMPRDGIVAYLEHYAERFNLPVCYDARVVAVEREPATQAYVLQTSIGALRAANVVVASGRFQQPKIPSFSAQLPAAICQLHSSEYRNPQALPAGAVLVVGSGQSGAQIAEDLYQSGRTVYLCVGSAGRLPRRYRGKDVMGWLQQVGAFDRTVDQLRSPAAKFKVLPHLSGTAGGHTLNLHQFARDGVVLLGRLEGVDAGKIRLAPDLKEKLAKADKFEADWLKTIDEHIEQNGLDAPTEKPTALRDGYAADMISELDLASAGINTVVWACGYRFDFSLVHLPVLDDDAYPIHRRGATRYAGLYFAGLPWLHKARSGNLSGVGDDAAFIASSIAARAADRRSTQIRLPAIAGHNAPIRTLSEDGREKGIAQHTRATRTSLAAWSRRN
jgi:putative flavoprotein involved in K+ transport